MQVIESSRTAVVVSTGQLGNWVMEQFAALETTAGQGKYWPIADPCFPSNDLRNNWGIHFVSSALLVSKVVHVNNNKTVLFQMNIISVDDLVSRPITVMNTIQEAVRVESRFDYTQALR